MTESDIIHPLHGRTPLPCPRDVTAPEGFEAQELHDPFEALMGPLFERVNADGSRVAAFVVDDRHVNADGGLHDGMMMTLADAFLGGAAWRGTGGKPCVTMSLQASFLGEAKAGDVVEIRTKVEKQTRSVMFVSAALTVAGEPLMSATSLWKVLGER